MERTGFRRIVGTSLVDECHAQIKEQLLLGRFGPDDRVRDSVLAEQMGVSRSPVREALRLLEQSGLLVKSANRSYRVASLTESDADELSALRLADETLAVRTIVRKSTPVRSLLPLITAISNAAAGSGEVATRDAEFHTAVVELAGLPRLTKRYSELTDLIRLLLLSRSAPSAMTRTEISQGHVLLFEALEASIAVGDPGTAIQAWEEHLTHVAETKESRASSHAFG